MKIAQNKLVKKFSCALALASVTWPANLLAATTTTLPWDQPLQTLTNDLQGTVAHALVTAAVISSGLMWSFSEHGSGVRKFSAVAVGGSLALGAATLMTTLFGAAAGALM
jgi:type IV secretory pathway VirB2 component (pilin)